MKKIAAVLSVLVSVSAHAATLYTAKEVVLFDPEAPFANAVLVEGERILDVGSVENLVEQYATASINHQFEDAVIVPGLINQHDHPLLAALMMATDVIAIEEWTLPGKTFPAAYDAKQYQELLSQYIAEKEGAAYFMSWGYHRLWHGDLNRNMLDEISSTLPVMIWQRSGHEFIMNTAALKLLDINEAVVAAVPPAARAQMDLAKGHFWEMGAMAVLPNLLPLIANPQRYEPALQVIKDYWHRAGATRVVEPGGLTFPWLMDTQLKVLGQAGSPFRMDYILDAKIIAKEHGIQGMVTPADAIVKNWGSDNSRYYPKQVKMFTDGAIFSQLMQMRDGYLDGHKGEWLTPPEQYKAMFKEFWQGGYQIHIHQNGDLGLDFLLDVLEDNMKAFPRQDHRTTIVHFGYSTPEQVERIAELGAIVSANPYYPVALGNMYSDHGVGPERSQPMVRLADLAANEVSFSLHADMPMAPGKPLFLMWCAVNRMDPNGKVVGPDQRVSPLQALKAVTIDAAYSLRQEKDIGSIEVGKLANLTVLAENPLTVDPMRIKDIKVLATVHEGTVFPVP